MAITKAKLIADGVITVDNLHVSHGIQTTHIGEGNNLYYTDARVGSYLSANNYITTAGGYFSDASLSANILTFQKSDGATDTIDLSLYLDDTNLARLVSGTLDGQTGIATFTRDDSSTFTVDFSSFLADANDYVSSGSFNTTTGVLTLTRLGGGTVTVDLDGKYAEASHTHLWADITDAPTALSFFTNDSGFLTSFTETDPVYVASSWYTTTNNAGNWDTAYGWGDHSLGGYLTSFTETDPVFTASAASGITSTQITNWDTAYGWGNHASAGYITGYTETDTLASVTGRGNSTTSIINGVDIRSQGQIRATGWYNTNSGTHTGLGTEIGVSAGQSYILSYNRDSSSYGILNFNASQVNTDNSFRAPIFYDSDDTGYYLNPAGSSILNGTVVIKGNDNQLAIDGTIGALASGLFFRESGTNKYELYHYSGEFRFYNYTTNQQEMSINNAGGYITSRTSFRAPIFYDSNNTGYYVDPASTSILNNTNAAEFKLSSSSNNGRFNGAGDWGTRFYTDSGYIWFGPANTGHAHIYTDRPNFYFNAQLTVNGGSVINTSDIRSTIFYDADNTVYYVDPNGTSELNNVTTGTRARWGQPRFWSNRQPYSSDQSYWTGTNGWGLDFGNWDTAWKGGFSGWDIWGENTGHPQGAGYIHAQGIMSGIHYASSDGASAYGWMMVGAGNATPNRYWLRGKWGGSVSSWVEMYHTGNMDAPNKSGTSYYQTNTWMQFNGNYGLYWPSQYGGHFRPNDGSTYTQFRIDGVKNSYGGIWDSYSSVNGIMYDSAGNGGVYREANGRWYFYHHIGNNCTGINTSTTSASYGLYVEKGIYSTGDIVAYSDVRKKTNIVTIDSALDKVTSLRGVYYDRIDDLEIGRQIGVIAQEVNEVLPEAVTYAEDIDEYGVKYGNIVGLLIEAIKEQQQQIDELKKLLNL